MVHDDRWHGRHRSCAKPSGIESQQMSPTFPSGRTNLDFVRMALGVKLQGAYPRARRSRGAAAWISRFLPIVAEDP